MKNKLIGIFIVGFSLFFISFILVITNEMSKAGENILNSPNVVDVTDIISTKVLVSGHDLPNNGAWTTLGYKDSDWIPIKIPSYQIVQQREFIKGNFAYYRITIPKRAFNSIPFLHHESSILLQSVFFSRLDISVNGNFVRINKPQKTSDFKLIVPIVEGMENLVAVKGYINEGDTGFDSRDKILLGQSTELNEIYSATYKGQTVFQLVFILCKGSILFIFALIFLLLEVDNSFEKFFIFGLSAVVEELIAGDYFFGPLTFNQMVYLYSSVNVVGAGALVLFLADLVKIKIKSTFFTTCFGILFIVSSLLAADALNTNYIVDLTLFMKVWNMITASILVLYFPKILKKDRLLFCGLFVVILLYIYGIWPSNNIGTNFKAYGNLLLFFMVAYQTFALFRMEQLQLKEQEKDVVIGKTASLLAHDVRKPLEQMKMVVERIVIGDTSKEFLEIAKSDIELSISNVTQQLNEIINYNKKATLTLKEVSFNRVLGHAIKQVMSIHQEMSLNLSYEILSEVKVWGDESRLTGILVNLISNAVEAIRDIGGKFQGTIKFHTSVSGEEFRFRIFNDGPNIPPTEIAKIFKPLYTSGKVGGTGLGLASCMKAANEMGATLKVKNEFNGVEFTLVMKAAISPDTLELDKFLISSKDYSYSMLKDKKDSKDQELRILILDADKNIKDEYQSQFQCLPYKVEAKFVDDFKSAEAIISKMRFDVYLLRKELGGSEVLQKHLSFLGTEVIIYSLDNIPNLSIGFVNNIYQSRARILFVDDTKLFRLAWQMFHGNHNITCVSSPEEALQLLSSGENEYDAYVIDFHFSNSSLDGHSLAIHIRDQKKDAAIFISSSIEQETGGCRLISKNQYEIRGLL